MKVNNYLAYLVWGGVASLTDVSPRIVSSCHVSAEMEKVKKVEGKRGEGIKTKVKAS